MGALSKLLAARDWTSVGRGAPTCYVVVTSRVLSPRGTGIPVANVKHSLTFGVSRVVPAHVQSKDTELFPFIEKRGVESQSPSGGHQEGPRPHVPAVVTFSEARKPDGGCS